METDGTALELVVDGGAPWGFRLQGGSEFRAPLQVTRVTPGGKAQRAGVHDGDFLLAINGNDCDNIPHNEALRLVKTAGSRLTLNISRGKAPRRARPTSVSDGKPSPAPIIASTSSSSRAERTSASSGPFSPPPTQVRSPAAETRLSFSPTHRAAAPKKAESASSSSQPAAATTSQIASSSLETPDGAVEESQPLPPETSTSPLPTNLPNESVVPASSPAFDRPSAPGRGSKRLTSRGSVPSVGDNEENGPPPLSPEIPEVGGAKDKSWYKQMFKTMHSGAVETESHFTSPAPATTTTSKPTPSPSTKPAETTRTWSKPAPSTTVAPKPATTSSLPRSTGALESTGQPAWRSSAQPRYSASGRGWYKEMVGKGGVSSTKTSFTPPKTNKPATTALSYRSSTSSVPQSTAVKSQTASTRSASISGMPSSQKPLATKPSEAETRRRSYNPVRPSSTSPPAEGYSSLNNALSDLNDAISNLQQATEEAAIRQSKKQTTWHPVAKDSSKAANFLAQVHQHEEEAEKHVQKPEPAETRYDWQQFKKQHPEPSVQKAPTSQPVCQPSPEQPKPVQPVKPVSSVVQQPSSRKVVEEVVQQVRQPEEFSAMTEQLEELMASLQEPPPKPAKQITPAPAPVKQPSPEPVLAKQPSPEPVLMKQPSPEPVLTKQTIAEPEVKSVHVEREPSPESEVLDFEPSPESETVQWQSAPKLHQSPEPIVQQASPEPQTNHFEQRTSPDGSLPKDTLVADLLGPAKPARMAAQEALPAISAQPEEPPPPEVQPGQGLGKALYSFQAQTKRELNFTKGEYIVLLRRVDANWLEGEYGGMKGIFPISYVKIIIDVELKSRTPSPTKSPVQSPPSKSPVHAVVQSPTTKSPVHSPPKSPEQALVSKSPPPEQAAVTSRPSSTSSSRSSSRPVSASPRPMGPPPDAPPNARARYSFHAESARELRLEKGDIVTLLRKVDQNWFEGQLRGVKGIFPIGYVDVLNPLPEKKPAQQNNSSLEKKKGPERPADGPRPKSVSSPTSTTPPATVMPSSPTKQQQNGEPWRALYNYKPNNSDELELVEGETILVVEQCDDGWFVGTSIRSNLFGTFPGNYVQKI